MTDAELEAAYRALNAIEGAIRLLTAGETAATSAGLDITAEDVRKLRRTLRRIHGATAAGLESV